MSVFGSLPQLILVVGSSGIIGRELLEVLCGELPHVLARVTLVQRVSSDNYHVVASEHLDLNQQYALRSWIDREPEAIVYLAGLDPRFGREVSGYRVNVEALADVLGAIPVIYASSTAVHAMVMSDYAEQKRQAERVLIDSESLGFALRFPTVFPRRAPAARTSVLNESLHNALLGRASVWRIGADRRIRMMSAAAAARHVVVALSICSGSRAVALDLPATIATPRLLCKSMGAPEPIIELDIQLDGVLADRSVDLSTEFAQRLGFPLGESFAELAAALKKSFTQLTRS